MPDDRERTQQSQAMAWAGIHEETEKGGDLAWWFSGGMSLLVWTGLAVLLTSA